MLEVFEYVGAPDLSAGVDPNKSWFPDYLIPIYHLPAYASFSERQKLLLNHAYAVRFAQTVILAETWLSQVCAALPDVPGQNTISLRQFIEEEAEHSRVYEELIQLSLRAFPQAQGYRFAPTSRALAFGTYLVGRFPKILTFWIWAALFFEERYISVWRDIRRTPNVDETHARVHHYHMREEIGHAKKDEEFIRTIWDKSPRWLRVLNAWLFALYFRVCMMGSRPARVFWDELVMRCPEFETHDRLVREQLRDLPYNDSYRKMLGDRRASPRLHRLAKQRPELGKLWERLVITD